MDRAHCRPRIGTPPRLHERDAICNAVGRQTHSTAAGLCEPANAWVSHPDANWTCPATAIEFIHAFHWFTTICRQWTTTISAVVSRPCIAQYRRGDCNPGRGRAAAPRLSRTGVVGGARGDIRVQKTRQAHFADRDRWRLAGHDRRTGDRPAAPKAATCRSDELAASARPEDRCADQCFRDVRLCAVLRPFGCLRTTYDVDAAFARRDTSVSHSRSVTTYWTCPVKPMSSASPSARMRR